MRRSHKNHSHLPVCDRRSMEWTYFKAILFLLELRVMRIVNNASVFFCFCYHCILPSQPPGRPLRKQTMGHTNFSLNNWTFYCFFFSSLPVFDIELTGVQSMLSQNDCWGCPTFQIDAFYLNTATQIDRIFSVCVYFLHFAQRADCCIAFCWVFSLSLSPSPINALKVSAQSILIGGHEISSMGDDR